MSKTILMNNGKVLRLVSGKIPRYSPPVTASTPTVTSNLTYNGSAQSPTIRYNQNAMTLGGTTSATNAGTYSVNFTLKSGYVWSDGSTGVKTANWSIGKADNILTYSGSDVMMYSTTTTIRMSKIAWTSRSGNFKFTYNSSLIYAYARTSSSDGKFYIWIDRQSGGHSVTTATTTTVSLYIEESSNYKVSNTITFNVVLYPRLYLNTCRTFNSTVTLPTSDIDEYRLTFTAPGDSSQSLYRMYISSTSIKYGQGADAFIAYQVDTGWVDENYRLIIWNNQNVSEEYYDWVMANSAASVPPIS